MKPVLKFVTMPLHLFSSDQISSDEKIVLMAIELHCSDSSGVAIGVQGIASTCGLTNKVCKQALKTLYEKGAIKTIIGEDGEKRLIPLIYKDNFSKQQSPELNGIKPELSINIDYDEVAQKWEEYCPTLPPIQRWTPARKSRLRSCLKQADISVDNLYKVFRIIGCTAFLSGQSDQFKATFDWVIQKSQNISKIYEGFYARSFQEKKDYENIIKGGDINQIQEDSFYR